MTDSSNETTEVLPTAEMPAVAPAAAMPEPAGAAPARYKTPEVKPATGTSKVLIIVAAAVLGFVVLGATFASGVMVGSTWAAGAAALRCSAAGPARRPGAGQLGGQQGRGFDQDGGRGHGRGGRGGVRRPDCPQGQTAAAGPGRSRRLDRAAPVAHGSGRLSAMRGGRSSDTLIS